MKKNAHRHFFFISKNHTIYVGDELMEIETFDNYKFLKFKVDNVVILFSTASGGLNFNCHTDEGLANLEKIKTYYNLESIGYLNQSIVTWFLTLMVI